MGDGVIDGVPAREILSMLRKAIREDWPVSHEQKIKSAQTIARIVENADNIFSPKDVMTATRVQLEMSNSNTTAPSGVICGVTSNFKLALRKATDAAPLPLFTW